MIPNINILDDLYVIAPIFNPASYKSRTDLYYQFEAHMKSSNINLITIECIYGENNEFNVTKSNNKNHIQLRTKNPLWHKENLINIAIKRLPSNWKYVLWLDADIEFLETDWALRVIEAFKKYEIIQVFKYAHFLGPNGKSMEAHLSFAYAIAEDLPICKSHYKLFYPHPGYGWGMTRSAFEHLNGLIECNILGSGDSHMAFSLIGRYAESLSFPHKMYTENFCKMIKKWQEKVKIYSDEKKIGWADCVIKHHFHGFKEDRQYVSRMKILIEGKFDPLNDLFADENGLLQLKETRKIMIDDVYAYFATRKEDVKEILPCMSAITVQTPEEIMIAALHVKKLIKVEKFNEIAQEFSEKAKADKRSKSTKNNKKKKDLNFKQTKPIPKPKKILIIEISSDINNFLDDSYEQFSTNGDKSCSLNFSDFDSIDNSGSPRKSPNASMDLIMRCGICTSTPKEDNRANGNQKNYNEQNYKNNTTTNRIVSTNNNQKNASVSKPSNNYRPPKPINNNYHNQYNVNIPRDDRHRHKKDKSLSNDSNSDKNSDHDDKDNNAWQNYY